MSHLFERTPTMFTCPWKMSVAALEKHLEIFWGPTFGFAFLTLEL